MLGRATLIWFTILIIWVALTVAFEFLAGHYLFGTPWPVLLADYRLSEGRVWILVLASTLLAPVLTATRYRPRSAWSSARSRP